MSTRMYAYRVDLDDLWDLQAMVRQWALTSSFEINTFWRHMATDYLNRLEGKEYEGNTIKYLDKWSAAPDDSRDNDDINLQIFPEDNGSTGLVRFLCNSHATRMVSEMEKAGFKLPLQEVFYDNSSDMDEMEELNKETADWFDKAINERRYMIIPVFCAMDVHRLSWNDDNRDPAKCPELALAIKKLKADRAKEPDDFLIGFVRRYTRQDIASARESIREIVEHYESLDMPAQIKTFLEPLPALLDQAESDLEASKEIEDRHAQVKALHAIDTRNMRASLKKIKEYIAASKALDQL